MKIRNIFKKKPKELNQLFDYIQEQNKIEDRKIPFFTSAQIYALANHFLKKKDLEGMKELRDVMDTHYPV